MPGPKRQKPARPAPDPTKKNQPRAFFGRKSGKRLHRGQDVLFQELLPALKIDLTEGERINISSLFPEKQKIILEIGYGGGEHLARKTIENPDAGFIGCEVFTGGIAKMLQKTDEKAISNLKLFTDDAIKLLNASEDAAFDEVYLLYPDPWPKKKHHKRRFISKMTLDALARTIKPGGRFHFATDIEDYANWGLAHILKHKNFSWKPGAPGSWHTPFHGWLPTRYEKKARKEGRDKSYYFSFQRNA